MKRCPECRRDYFDETLLYCLDDGSALLEGPGSVDEAATAILDPESSGLRTKHLPATKATRIPGGQPARLANRTLLAAGVVGLLLASVFAAGGYIYYSRSSGRQIESMAVMPFINESGNADAEYL